jgi:DNA-binding transcriptional ArsR family regulator
MAILLSSQIKALAHPARIALLGWLKEPQIHFPPQVDGDPVTDGICAVFITQKWQVAQPTASRHLKLMVDGELLIPTRKKGWTFYRRNEAALAVMRQKLESTL